MSSQTTNIKLKKPAADENINLGDINSNWDAIDAAFGALGTVSATNNVKYTMTQESAAARFKSTSSSTWDATASGITGLADLLTADVKAQIGALANAVDTLAASNSIATGSVTLQYVTATYTVPSTSASNTAYAGVVLTKRTSTAYSAMVLPTDINIPFYMRRNSGTRQIRVTI